MRLEKGADGNEDQTTPESNTCIVVHVRADRPRHYMHYSHLQATQIMTKTDGVQSVLDAYEVYGFVLPVCAKELICCMLHADPTKRITLEELLLHPFFSMLPIS